MINPEIVERDGEVLSEEGCLSVPGYRFEVVRSERVTMRGLDLDGNELVLEGDDLLARMIQHEIDHLDGVLLLDRVEPDVRREALRDMRTRELGATASHAALGPTTAVSEHPDGATGLLRHARRRGAGARGAARGRTRGGVGRDAARPPARPGERAESQPGAGGGRDVRAGGAHPREVG